ELIHCIGGCCQSFHPGCLEDKVSSVADFTCKHCKDDNHACFICKKNSSVETQLGEVKRCTVLKCGRSYHSECLIAQAMINSSKCTLHQCGTCTTKEKEDTNNVANPSRCKLFRCIKCPTAFHIGDECIAAGSIMLPGLNIICPDHFEPLKTTPHHQPVHVSWCFVCSKGGELMCCETCPASFHPICVGLDKTPDDEWFCRDCRNKKRPLYGEIVWVKLGSYRWWPGEITHPNEIPDNIQRLQHGIGEFVVRFFGSNDYFWLNKRRVFAYQEGDTGATSSNCSRGISSVFNKALQEAQESFEELVSRQQKIQDVKQQKKRPVYKHIKVNRPIGSVQIYTAELSEIPRCICKKTDPNPCGPESECLNRMLMYECHADLCPAGDKCQNQHFQKRDYPQSEVFKTTWGGWALKTKTLIKKGEFVSEYVGELVDGEECMRRIEHAHKNNVTNFYMLTIDKDRIIDAGPKGNYSRFMNHCCDPNCETQKWTVNGDTRVGLFALGEIAAGEELTFNYNLDCLGNDKTPCMCGSSNCSGFIGVRPKNGNGNNKSVKRKRRRNESKNLPKHDDFCFRCRQVGTLVCCDVRACQRAFCLACLRLTKPPFGKWQCPWHHCDFCGRRAQHFCHFCPNSFCASH
uniref:Histone-lysine N-methyltransferase n=1 Tax=Ciona savignyi TaxID=51511 RepID=H2ZL78_CIOSA